MFSIAFNLIFVPIVVKNFLRFDFVDAFMLVHGSFCLSASVGFKFDLNSNRFELFRNRSRKEKEK